MEARLVKKADADKVFRLVWKDTPATVELKGDVNVKGVVEGWVREFKAIANSRNPRRDFDRLFSAV